ncbi:MAG: NADP-dependent phosphogluconate dehydrogenase [Saprospiraceae bacterium]
MTKAMVGMIGLGTMGRNLVLNMADHDISVCGYDKDTAQQKRLSDENNRKVTVASSIGEFMENLELPRKIILLVPAGKIVDYVISDLKPLLTKDDILIDGGNSHFTDTDRRYADLQVMGVHFMGMGVSGGEKGARYGPSMMPGSNKESYEVMRPILEKIAAQADGKACVQFIGNGAAGHYTKMVHNGIEYAMMQMISEVYGLLKAAGMSNDQLHDFFVECNASHLQGYLVEITADVFLKEDELTNNRLVDMILDKAGQKGTGMWTSQSALDLLVPITIIDSAVSMRYISSFKEERVKLAGEYQTHVHDLEVDLENIKHVCKEVLYLGFILCYAQGLHLLQVASNKYTYEVHIAHVLEVWKGGCIIRSALLNHFQQAYQEEPNLMNPIASPHFVHEISDRIDVIKIFLKICLEVNISSPAISAAYQYITSYTTGRLPSNLIQAQRDYFGAHTYERLDQAGIFHSEWELSHS